MPSVTEQRLIDAFHTELGPAIREALDCPTVVEVMAVVEIVMRRQIVRGAPGKAVGLEPILGLGMQRGLIAFKTDQTIRLLGTDLRDDALVAKAGIQRDQTAFDVEPVQ